MSNREIKFSCMWSDGESWWDLRYSLEDMCNGNHWDDMSDSPMLKKFIHKHTRQYTGLKDKNGKEIYEGDIVGKCTQGRYWVVEWGSFGDTGYYAFNGLNSCRELEVDFDTVVFIPDQSEIIEALVIGNIYENPDLIGE